MMEKWLSLKKELDEIFFKPRWSVIKKGSVEYKDFWEFLERYAKFKSKSKPESSKSTLRKYDDSESKLNLPRDYDQRYKVNLALTAKNLDALYQSLPRESAGKVGKVTKENFKEFKSIILYYLDFCQKQKFTKLVKLRTDQENLPIRQYKDQITYAVQTNQVVLVAGDTGCGKSTQVPQYLLSAGFMKIACTQPRRIACMSLAKRVAHETLNEYGSEVAYQVRFDTSKSKATRILFLTEGLLLRQFHGDPTLSQYNVIVVDEVHERHLNGDFLLGVLYCLLQQRKDLKLILMSATINISLFAEYFEGAPVIQVPGRLYPIELQYVPHYLEKSEREGKSERLNPSPFLKVMQSIDHKYPATERGDLLIFMSGMSEIEAVVEAGQEYAKKSQRWIVLPLHSALSIEEQDKVFDIAPTGVRKCIVSTNIAETSITIDGVRFIADSGKVKEMRFDSQTKMQRLQELWISQASAEQRKGRAGRTGPGVCFRLYSEEDYASFAEYSTPEIRRVPLDSLVLQMADFGLRDATKFPFLESPTKSNLENAIYFLKLQNALKDNGELTSLGQMLAKLPVDISVGTLLIMGTLFNVTEPVLIIAAALSVQSPLTRRIGNEFQVDVDERRRELESEHGDAFFLLNLYDEWTSIKSDRHNSSRKWCRRRGLEEQRFYEMAKLKRQFEQLLKDYHLIQRKKQPQKRYFIEERNPERGKLLKLKRSYHHAPRKRKVLKLDHGDVEIDHDSENDEHDSEDDEHKSIDIHDIEFKLTHDLNELQKTRNRHREFTMKDLNVLKLILCSGLYPQIAFPDETNPYRKQSEQLYHTKDKQFLLLHPTSIYSMRPALLETDQQDDNESAEMSHSNAGTSANSSKTSVDDTRISPKCRHLMAYVSLLETNKPYLVNVIKVPALATLLLFSRSLDTNSDCSRIVCDEWLELIFTEGDEGQEILSKVVQLRSAWLTMLDAKLSLINQENDDSKDAPQRKYQEEQYNRDLLSRKLAAFLEAEVSYKFRRISTSDKDYLYVASSEEDVKLSDVVSVFAQSSSDDLAVHPTKGGMCVTDYLTFGCLRDSDAVAVASGEAEFLRQHYHCNVCGEHLICTIIERLEHDRNCHLKMKSQDSSEPPSIELEENETPPPLVNSDQERIPNYTNEYKINYYCELCKKEYVLTAIEILKHKGSHA